MGRRLFSLECRQFLVPPHSERPHCLPAMMSIPFYMALPLMAALMYAYGSLYFKEAFKHGIGVNQAFVVTSWVMALVFVPMIFFERERPEWIECAKPLACALLFLAGHWFTFAAFRRGEMSVVVPAMGTKAVFVAVGAAAWFGKEIPSGMWLAAILAAVGIFILGRSDIQHAASISPALLLAILSAAGFGLCDAAVQAWAPEYGAKGFLGAMFLATALLSTVSLKAANQPLRDADRAGMKALIIGAAIIALQGILVAISVVSFDNATGVNVVYSSRGLWSVLLVWHLGHRFHSLEDRQNPKIFFSRLAGAGIMIFAVVLATWESAKE